MYIIYIYKDYYSLLYKLIIKIKDDFCIYLFILIIFGC